MSEKSTIEWTDATWNPVRGCDKISPGCRFCYAARFAERFRNVVGHPYQQGFDLRLVPEKLAEPLRWSAPKTVFVNSMSDLFHRDVPEEYIELVVNTMQLANWHTYQVLTKRADRQRDVLTRKFATLSNVAHICWGVSVEERKFGLPRIAQLQETPAAVRFLSVEPLLEDLGPLNLSGIHWVIVGGESGPGARPMNPAWVRDIRDQCASAGVPFFFKQWGGSQKSKYGRVLDGVTHDEMPPRSVRPIASREERLAMIDRIASQWSADTSGSGMMDWTANNRPAL